MDLDRQDKETRASGSNQGSYNAASEKECKAVAHAIAAARKRRGLTVIEERDLLRRYGLDVSGSTLSRWESGETVPNAYQFMALCHALGVLNPLDFFSSSYVAPLNEEGMRMVQNFQDELIACGLYTGSAEVERSYVTMPVYELNVLADCGDKLLETCRHTDVPVVEGKVPSNAHFGVRICGDSMAPVYRDSQIVWVNRDALLSNGDVGVFAYNGHAYVKVYHEEIPGREEMQLYTDSRGNVYPKVVLMAYNMNYEPIVVHPYSPIYILGKVVG